jgi:hypothetical protein
MRPRIRRALLAFGAILIVADGFQFGGTARTGSSRNADSDSGLAFLIRRASRKGIAPRPADIKGSLEVGGGHYGLDCGTCHGVDGGAQTPSRRWMSPRVTDLTSSSGQNYSDQELNWIIQNAIRFTRMPGLDKVETPEHIWAS